MNEQKRSIDRRKTCGGMSSAEGWDLLDRLRDLTHERERSVTGEHHLSRLLIKAAYLEEDCKARKASLDASAENHERCAAQLQLFTDEAHQISQEAHRRQLTNFYHEIFGSTP